MSSSRPHNISSFWKLLVVEKHALSGVLVKVVTRGQGIVRPKHVILLLFSPFNVATALQCGSGYYTVVQRWC